MKNGKPAWPRWLMLVAALLLCWSIWDEAGVYAALTARPVFSPEETAAIAAGFRSGWAIRGLAAAMLFYQFAVWRRPEDGPRPRLRDGVFLSACALIWAGLWLWIIPEGTDRLYWAAILLAMAGGAAWNWRRYFKLRSRSAAINHEEEACDER